jgi:hypothetical protein
MLHPKSSSVPVPHHRRQLQDSGIDLLLSRMNSITQDEFNDLAMYVAVAEELRREPFFSEDNHETLCPSDGGFSAFLCHPAFLKSAVLPFRKLWLESEPCAYTAIRDLVFRIHPDRIHVEPYRHWFFDCYTNELGQVVDSSYPQLTNKDLIEIWLYTHAVHAGPKKVGKGRSGRTIEEFDLWARTLGRERFEYYFRAKLRSAGKATILPSSR